MISQKELEEILVRKKEPKYRARQVLNAIYKEGKNDFSLLTALPAELREFLRQNIRIFSFKEAKDTISPDKKVMKTLFKLSDEKSIEGVLMKFSDGRNSVCVSSQVGCGLRCAFCATGTMGFFRNLGSEEISDQVLYFDQKCKKEGSRVTHVVFMGMGEPFLNYENVMKACDVLRDKNCLGIAARRITISTSGVIPGIEKFTNENSQINLAVSLHAPNQDLREKLMPIAKSYKLENLMDAIKAYIKLTHRRVSYEYVMLRGVNDSTDQARELAKLISGQMCHLNLIPYNETYLGFKNSGEARISHLKKTLESFGIPVTVRVSLGQKVKAACGQLTLENTPCSRR